MILEQNGRIINEIISEFQVMPKIKQANFHVASAWKYYWILLFSRFVLH